MIFYLLGNRLKILEYMLLTTGSMHLMYQLALASMHTY
jgi:hypothetical protein